MAKINGLTIRKIRQRRTYEPRELAETCEVHVQTVRRWRKSGLEPIVGTIYPLLFMGSTIRDFLYQKFVRPRLKLSPKEFYCLKCRCATNSRNKDLIVEATGKKIGRNEIQTIIHGKCCKCGSSCRRISTVSKAELAFPRKVVLWLGVNSLEVLQTPNLNTHNERSNQDEH